MARLDREREKREKLNTGSEPAETGETYSLEDIMNEFGGWSNRSESPKVESAPPAEPEEPVQADMDQETEPEPPAISAPDEQPEPPRGQSRFRFINLDLSAEQETAQPAKDAPEVWSWRGESVESAAPEAEKLPRPAARREKPWTEPERPHKRESRPPRRRERKETEQKKRAPVSPAAALRRYRARSAFMRLRAIFLTLLTLAAVVLTLAPLFPFEAMQKLGDAKAVPTVLLILMCICAAASLDLIVRAVTQVLTLRFGLELLLTVSFAVCVVDSVGALIAPRVPYCAVACIGFLYAAWSEYLTCVGRIRSLRVAAEGSEHYSVKLARSAWNDLDCAYKAPEELPEYAELLEEPDCAAKAMRLYVPLALSLSLVFSIVCNLRSGVPLVRMLSACLCAAIPVCGFICYARPFALIAARLARVGAALCGWSAAKILGGDLGEVVCDGDLYPTGSVTINGVKVYHEYRLEQMLCYAATAISMSDSHLKPLFVGLAEEQGIRLAEVGSFRTYEGGGVGAEIRGDIVLVGSLGFMHLMGVRLPQGTNIRQAVYVAVNGFIAGVVAINYAPASQVVSAMQSAVRHRGLSIVGATRDFLISPAMLHAKFRIPTTRTEFPPVSDRYRLSSLSAENSMDTAAILSRSSILPFSEAIVGARCLKSTVSTGLAVNLFAGLFGLLVVFFLGMGGALETASAVNVLLFVLIWTVPGLLITMWVNRF